MTEIETLKLAYLKIFTLLEEERIWTLVLKKKVVERDIKFEEMNLKIKDREIENQRQKLIIAENTLKEFEEMLKVKETENGKEKGSPEEVGTEKEATDIRTVS